MTSLRGTEERASLASN